MALTRLTAALTALAITACAGAPVTAQTLTRTNGGDIFAAGPDADQTFAAPRDVYAAGRVVTARGAAAGDVHLAGFDVNQETDTAGNLMAMGASVSLDAPVAGDTLAIGFSVRSTPDSVTQGNAFLAANSVTVDGPVTGALTAFGQEVTINARIAGDAWIVAQTIRFGPDAVIGGTLSYSAPDAVSVPERVIAPDRVTFEKFTPSRAMKDMHENWNRTEYPALPDFMSLFAMFLVSLAFFIALGAIFLTFLPKPVEQMRAAIDARPGQTFLVGVVGLSMLFGMVPIVALTIFGIPLVPIVLLAIVAAWTLGYALGAYAVALRVWRAFGGSQDASTAMRLVAFALAIFIIAILNFIPFVGWVANYTLVLLGIGAMTAALFNRVLGNPGIARDVDMNKIDEEEK